MERLTLGNLGFSSSECLIQPMGYSRFNNADIRCTTGVLTHLIDFGINTKAEDQNQCRKDRNNICSKYILERGHEGIYSVFQNQCEGKDSCIIKNFDKFLSRKGDKNVIEACLELESRVFFQYACEQTEEQLKEKKKDATKVIFIELTCIALVILFIFFVKHRTQVLAKRYVKNHVQVMDYTMFFQLNKNQLK